MIPKTKVTQKQKNINKTRHEAKQPPPVEQENEEDKRPGERSTSAAAIYLPPPVDSLVPFLLKRDEYFRCTETRL